MCTDQSGPVEMNQTQEDDQSEPMSTRFVSAVHTVHISEYAHHRDKHRGLPKEAGNVRITSHSKGTQKAGKEKMYSKVKRRYVYIYTYCVDAEVFDPSFCSSCYFVWLSIKLSGIDGSEAGHRRRRYRGHAR